MAHSTETDTPPKPSLLRRRQHRRRNGWQKAALVIGVLCQLIAMIAVISHYVPVHTTALLGLVAFSPYLTLFAVPAGALLLVARLRGGVSLSLGLLLISGLIQAPLFIAATPPANGISVTTMTSNLQLGTASPTSVVKAVRANHVDVLMLQELTPEARILLEAAGLDEELPHHVAELRSGAQGTGLWSRFPLSDPQKITDYTFAFVTAHVNIEGLKESPRFVATHMAGPFPGPATAWARDIDRLPAYLKSLSGKVVVGGDFNATPDTVQFRRLLVNGFADGAAQAGAGLVRSWPEGLPIPPAITIDHVLTRGGVATSVKTIPIANSDHLAVVATVSFPR